LLLFVTSFIFVSSFSRKHKQTFFNKINKQFTTMMKRLFTAATLTLLTLTTAFAQREETVFGNSNFRLTGVWGGTTYSVQPVNGHYNNYRSGFWAVEFNKSTLVGWAHYDITNLDLAVDAGNRYHLKTNGLYIESALGRGHKSLHPTLGVVTSVGELSALNQTDRVWTVQPMAGLEVNVFRWMRAGVRGGYRFTMDTDIPTKTDANYSGGFGELTFRFGWSWGSARSRNNKD
jgi:hypothetical protein